MGRSDQLAVRAVSRLLARVGAVSSFRPRGSEVAITFDDGPDAAWTPQILDALRDQQVHATFFLLGSRIHGLESLVGEVLAEGHEIASHGLDHRKASAFPYGVHRDRLRRAQSDLEDMTGRHVLRARPPYGQLTVGWFRATRSLGLQTVLWSRESGDAEHIPDSQRFARATDGVAAGDILLAHDGFADARDGADDGPAPEVDRARLIGRVLQRYRAGGLDPCSLAEAFSGRPTA